MLSKNYLVAFLFSIAAHTLQAQEDCRPVLLRCEYLVNPIGLDEAHPRLSWQLQDTRTGAGQNAYRITVGTDSLAVVNGKGNMWQLQQTGIDQRIRYAGQPLLPFSRYYWNVQIWGKDNQSAVSEVAVFETGMMNMANWQGAWISDDKSVDEKAAPYFRTVALLSKPIRSARAYIAAAGLYELSINGQRVGDHVLDPAYTRFDR
ncbi:MAG: alpha-L-rhamnosidase N-terminal domain-containing protein, partial [Chitinophagaceae bacterium]|nr:alpha-L-rhamnosidase N-terminal domain-containing protein [Chitinophagaceae bacterium]